MHSPLNSILFLAALPMFFKSTIASPVTVNTSLQNLTAAAGYGDNIPSPPSVEMPSDEWRQKMKACFDNFNGKWGKTECNGKVWDYSQDGGWRNPQHCHQACKGIMMQAIWQGLQRYLCIREAGFANCYVSYSWAVPE
ncbi:hypothetical protein BX600DRAFT_439736 [Xylariales sp. PMI_506]|nr:hypothetical protein BX600DRAFT_439736 [Xylariales sp. PMI_506]